MSDLMLGLILGAVGGFGFGALWLWRIVDRALREFEQGEEPEGSLTYRLMRIVR